MIPHETGCVQESCLCHFPSSVAAITWPPSAVSIPSVYTRSSIAARLICAVRTGVRAAARRERAEGKMERGQEGGGSRKGRLWDELAQAFWNEREDGGNR